jgi:integrase
MAIHRLTAATVRNAGPGMWPDGGGLYLQSKSGAGHKLRKSWIYRYVIGKRARHMGLGPVDVVSLAQAREQAALCRRMLFDRIDPLEHRSAGRMKAVLDAAKAMTFDMARDAYIKAHASGWRNPKHRQQWTNSLQTYCTPIFGKVSVQDVDVALIMKALEPIWLSKNETATRVRGRVETVLDWAKVRGLRSGDNPAQWRGHLDHLLAAPEKVHKVTHHPSLPHAEIGSFIARLRDRTGVAAAALEFAVLTAARTNEVLGAKWDEIDGEVWTVPASRMKAGREHRVPLSKPAIAIIEKMRALRESEYVFPGSTRATLSNMALLMTLRRMGRTDLTAHGFRSTFRTWAAERTNFPHEVVEAALAHSVGDKVVAAYQRGDFFDKRQRLMEAWAACCDTQVVTSKVVSIR